MLRLFSSLAVFLALLALPASSFAAGLEGAAQALAKSSNIKEDAARDQIEKVFAAVASQLKAGQEVTVRNFGKFYVQDRQARKGRNPKTGAPIEIAAKRYPKFSSSEALKQALNPAVQAETAKTAPEVPAIAGKTAALQ